MNLFLQNQEVRFESQRRKRLLRVLRHVQQISLIVFAWLLGMAALYGAYVLVMDRDLFTVTRVDVEGDLRHLNADEIRTLSGVEPGQNLFRIDMTDIQRHIFEHPWVAEVTVRRKLPHTVWIYVSEREPVAIMTVDNQPHGGVEGGRLLDSANSTSLRRASAKLGLDTALPAGRQVCRVEGWQVEALPQRAAKPSVLRSQTTRALYIDSKGATFPAGDSALEDLPVMTGFADATNEDVQRGITLLSNYQRHPIFGEFGISELHLDASQGFSIVGSHILVMIRLGWRDFDTKLNQFAALWPTMRTRGATPSYVDTNVTGKVIAKYDN